MPTAERRHKRSAPIGTVDWPRVRATTDREIARQIADDPETAPDLTGEALDRATVIGPDGQQTPYRDKVEGPQATPCLAPGTRAPRSGRYEIVGPRGGRTGEERTVAKGEPLPPTPTPGQSYRSVRSGQRRDGA